MKTPAMTSLENQLSERDHEILVSLERFRLLNTRQIQRLHFAHHESELAAARSVARAMKRLESLGAVASLDRRIGGVRRGSASYVWQLAATGERFLRATRGQAQRRRFTEPGLTFVDHTLAVNEVAVGLLEANRTIKGFTAEEVVNEPKNWRSYIGPNGETRWLKPDLYVITVHEDDEGEYEEHAFLEIDLGTEHLPRIRAKCAIYAAYQATGAYQAEHGIFPAVVWLSPSPARRAALRAAVSATGRLPGGLFQVADPEEYVCRVAAQ